MRHLFLYFFLLIICSFNGCRHHNEVIEEEKPFKINGILEGADIESFVFEYYRCVKENRVIDTISVVNGKFTIEGIISPRADAWLTINDKDVFFYLDPGEMQLYFKKDSLESFILKGSQSQVDSEMLKAQINPLQDYLYKIKRQLFSEQNEQHKDFLIRQKDSTYNVLENICIDFITSHPNSYSSLDAITSLLFQNMQNGDVLMSFFDRLSESVKASCSGKMTYNFIVQRKKSSTTHVSSFEAFDKDGSLVKISDFKGKYILIDFWATWCVPCINGFPHLKELYAKYKDQGLVMISISIDKEENEQEWLNAIEKFNTTEWIHILSCKNKGENNICDLHDNLLGSSIPHYILIDQSGNVIKHWRGFSDEIAKEQNEMLKNIFENKL